MTINSFQGQYRWLSNFWPCQVDLNGTLYPTLEHAYQAAKMVNDYSRHKILHAPTPGQAKRLGRLFTMRSDWAEVKVPIMTALLRYKFINNVDLNEKLLATYPARLCEGNTRHDNFWGSCTCPQCGNQGQNMLGQLLMEIRHERWLFARSDGHSLEGLG